MNDKFCPSCYRVLKNGDCWIPCEYEETEEDPALTKKQVIEAKIECAKFERHKALNRAKECKALIAKHEYALLAIVSDT